MREIIFRGKRVDNGEWVYGYYYGMWDKKYILWGEHNHIPEGQEVIPETVGQYTGLKDKNGKMIFEGDVVRLYDSERLTFQVNYDERRCGFYVGADYLSESDSQNIEIIGNIHDQKEDA